MLQVRLHGRGGRGVVTAAEMLSIAAFQQGQYAQAFPGFGSERSDAPKTVRPQLDLARRRLSCGVCVADRPCGAIEMRPEEE